MQSKPYQKPFPVLTCSTVKEWLELLHPIRLLLERKSAVLSCVGITERGWGFVRVNDPGSVACAQTDSYCFGLCLTVPSRFHVVYCNCHFNVSLFLYTVYKETVYLLLPKALLQPKNVKRILCDQLLLNRFIINKYFAKWSSGYCWVVELMCICCVLLSLFYIVWRISPW